MDFVLTEAGRNISLISFGVVLLSTIVRYFTLDKEKMKESKKRMKEHKDKMKEAQKKGDTQALKKHQSNMLSESMENMKHGMKPMIFTMIPMLLIFGWMRGTYGEYGTAFDVMVYEVYPQGLVDIIDTDPEGALMPESAIVRWNLGNISAGKDGTIKTNIKASIPTPSLKEQTEFKLAYTTRENETKTFTGSVINSEDTIITLSRSAYTSTEGGVQYNIEYENKEFITKIGSYKMGWLGTYIIISFASSIILNKVFRLT